MGIIAVLLFSTGRLNGEFHVPTWVIISSYSAISLGTLAGGWKVIRTLGMSLTHLKPVHGFCAETAGAATIIMSSIGGIPVSTTHTITGSIMGVGMTRSLSAINWNIVGKIILAWVLTIPGTVILSGGIYAFINYVFL
jgi:PiT family inorganic phosphate transporter